MRLSYCLLFYFLLLVSQSLFATDEDLVQQVVVHNNGTRERVLYHYNSLNEKVLELRQQEVNNARWENKSCIEWICNSDSSLIVQSHRIWDNGAWKDSFQLETAYRDDSLPISRTTSVFDEQNEKVIAEKWECTYDENAQISTEVSYKSENGNLQACSNLQYVYDTLTLSLIELQQTYTADDTTHYRVQFEYADSAQSKLSRQIMQKLDVEQCWINHLQYEWYYDLELKNPLQQTMKKWQNTAAGMAWVNMQNVQYAYADDKIISEIYRYWNVEYWENDLRYLYEYANSDDLQRKITQMPIYNKWRSVSTLNYSYEQSPRKEIVESVFDFWGGETDALNFNYIPFVFNYADNIETIKAEEIEITYQRVQTQEPGLLQTPVLLNVFPNPSNGIYYIDTFGKRALSYSIIASNGQLLETQVLNNTSSVINISNYPAGIYTLRVVAEDGIVMKKLIKQQ